MIIKKTARAASCAAVRCMRLACMRDEAILAESLQHDLGKWGERPPEWVVTWRR